MTTRSHLRNIHYTFALLVIAAVGTIPAHLAAQSTGSIEFTAHVAPTDARPEPVRQMTFYLLNESLASLRQEAVESDAPPDLGKFVDALKVSAELKAWMKKNQTVQLSGGDFTKSLTPDAIVDVPEFFAAYMKRSEGYDGVGFPKPKYKEKDREANTEKYKALRAEYIDAIRKFIGAVPDSVSGIEADLTDVNPYEPWSRLVVDQKSRTEKHALQEAQIHHMAAQADTNLDGSGSFSGLPPGDYWLGTLDTQAIAGDARLRWDVRVTVRPGEITRVRLTNLNAVEQGGAAPKSNR